MDRRVDVAIAIAVAGLGVVILVTTQQIADSPVPDPIGPRGIPNVLGGFFLVAGVALAVRRLIRWRRAPAMVPAEGSEDDAGVAPGSAPRALSIGLAAMAYVVMLPFLGFPIATPLFTGFMLRRLAFDRRPVLRIPAIVFYPVVFTVATYLFFATFLGVRLPIGFVRDIFVRMSGS